MAKIIHRTVHPTRQRATIDTWRAPVDAASSREPRRWPPIGVGALVTFAALLAGCSSAETRDVPETPDTPETQAAPGSAESTSSPVPTTGEQRFPDVVSATAERQPDDTWTFHATLSSPYDTAERYADAWRVLAPDGEVLAVRELLHDHAAEQPFTRSLSGVSVPEDVDMVTIEGRDQTYGWGGSTTQVQLER